MTIETLNATAVALEKAKFEIWINHEGWLVCFVPRKSPQLEFIRSRKYKWVPWRNDTAKAYLRCRVRGGLEQLTTTKWQHVADEAHDGVMDFVKAVVRAGMVDAGTLPSDIVAELL